MLDAPVQTYAHNGYLVSNVRSIQNFHFPFHQPHEFIRMIAEAREIDGTFCVQLGLVGHCSSLTELDKPPLSGC